MIGIGQKVPLLRTPAFMQGALTLFDLSAYRHRWLALCSLPNFGLLEATLLDRQRDDFDREGTSLLALCPDAPTFHASWIRQTPHVRVPILADPLGRLHRLLGIGRESVHGHCGSVLIDPSGVLRCRLAHTLNGRGINAIKEALIANQRHPSSRTEGSDVLIAKGAFAPCIR